MKKCLFSLILLVVSTLPLAAQNYRALLLDKADQQPVAYANIGVLDTDLGVNSDSAGIFNLNLDAAHKDKMLLITLIGYKDYKVKVSEFISTLNGNDHKIYLEKSENMLKEVVIKPVKLTMAKLGNDARCSAGEGASLPFPYIFERKQKKEKQKKEKQKLVDTLTEIGTLMKVKKKKTFVDSVQINVGKCTHAELLYRLNIYEELDGDFKNILQEPIYIRLSREQVGRAVNINLTDKNIVVNHNFIVSIEKVKDLGPGEFSICAKLFGGAMYVRVASHHDRFIKLPVIGMGMVAYVTFSEEEK